MGSNPLLVEQPQLTELQRVADEARSLKKRERQEVCNIPFPLTPNFFCFLFTDNGNLLLAVLARVVDKIKSLILQEHKTNENAKKYSLKPYRSGKLLWNHLFFYLLLLCKYLLPDSFLWIYYNHSSNSLCFPKIRGCCFLA